MLAILWILRLISAVCAVLSAGNLIALYQQHVAFQSGATAAIPSTLWDVLVTLLPLAATYFTGKSWWPLVESIIKKLGEYQSAAISVTPSPGPQPTTLASRFQLLQALNVIADQLPVSGAVGSVDAMHLNLIINGKPAELYYTAPGKTSALEERGDNV